MKTTLHKFALSLELGLDRIRRQQKRSRVIEAYAGYATPTTLVARGRVLTSLRKQNPAVDAAWLTNLREMISLFLTDEVADVTVRTGETETTSDEEGYFTLSLPRQSATGWVPLPVRIEGFEDETQCFVLVPSPEAKFMIISDIDDTVLETGAYSLARNLWTSMTGNIVNRRVYADAVRLLRDLSEEGRNPVYYVSSSPWNLYSFLTRIFARNDLTRGPMFLRDLGLSEDKFITAGHGSHKGASIQTILEANPTLPALLMGDTGQKDAKIYADVIEAFPDRVKAVILRETNDGSDAVDKSEMLRIRNAGVEVFHGPQMPPSRDVARLLTSET